MTDLPAHPRLLDIGCGPGMQTLQLAKISAATILAIDNRQPYLDTLTLRANQAGLSDRISVLNKSMFKLDFKPGSFDAIWSEGAIYIIGFERGLRKWQPFLKKGGYMAVTELSWLKPAPPAEIKTFWNENYPGMQTLEQNLATLRKASFREIGKFVLPSSGWWEGYYTPLEQRISVMAEKYQDNEEALAFLRSSQREINLYRQYSEWYGYIFYIMQKVTDNDLNIPHV
jgi:cyclopropane fatty-acyl-phospholipid synthase-like methyltransferase